MFNFNARIVVKVGTSTLAYSNGKTNLRHMEELVRVLADLLNSGVQVALVSSGAIGVGIGKLGLTVRPGDTPGRQAASAVGQCELMFMYDKMFGEYGHTVGQLLITKNDVDDLERRNNLVNAFEKLFAYGAIPIINENDSVAIDEIVYGDNDNLSATVARLIGADILIILTDRDGLYDADPALYPNAKRIPVVEEITEDIMRLAGGAGSKLGTGGMCTKIQAARLAGEAGICTAVINGSRPQDIYSVLEGKDVGTIFKAVKK